MKLTADQDAALVQINNWLKAKKTGKWMFSLAGFAGTGKTTLLKKLIEGLNQPFICCAPTGKAASVLRSKLRGVVVRTVHQVLYQPQGQSLALLEKLQAQLEDAKANDKPIAPIKLAISEERQRLRNENVSFTVKPGSDITPGKLVIVDEASMISASMLEDFERTGCRALFVGDSGQLPPVKDASWFMNYEHDAQLNQIVRQALDSPIIRLSMMVRAGVNPDSPRLSDDCFITTKDKLTKEEWLAADQILTGGNDSRRRINRFFRKALGRADSPLPVNEEKMICLKNNHRKIPPWINGIQFIAQNCAEKDGWWELNADYEGAVSSFDFYPHHCQFHYDQTLEELPREERKDLFEADFAYAITVHKSQGSEWPFVIVADDKIQLANKGFRRRWLYTAVTRAKSKLIVVQ